MFPEVILPDMATFAADILLAVILRVTFIFALALILAVTLRLELVVILPATNIAPPTPMPPVPLITNAPVVVLVDKVPAAATRLPCTRVVDSRTDCPTTYNCWPTLVFPDATKVFATKILPAEILPVCVGR